MTILLSILEIKRETDIYVSDEERHRKYILTLSVKTVRPKIEIFIIRVHGVFDGVNQVRFSSPY